MSEHQSITAWFESHLGESLIVPHIDEAISAPIGRVKLGQAVTEPMIMIPASDATQYVSRRHAMLHRADGGGFELEDLNSSGGVFIDGTKLDPGKRVPLKTDSKVRLANYEMTFRIKDDADYGAEESTGGGLGEKTNLLENMFPSTPEALAGMSRFFLDVEEKGKVTSVEIEETPLRRRWIIGRAAPEGEQDPVLGYLQVTGHSMVKSISRKHALLTHTIQGHWTIRNLSAQGTKVNDRPLEGETELTIQHGDRITMGGVDVVLRRQLAGPAAPVGSAPGAEEFSVSHDSMMDSREVEVTRDMVARSAPLQADAGDLPRWGALIENKLLDPRKFDLYKRKTVIGSHPISCDIRLEDPGIDDIHAQIQWQGNGPRIKSRGQNNPVKVNHKPVRLSGVLATGAVITLGNKEFKLEVTGRPPELVSAAVLRRVRITAILTPVLLLLAYVTAIAGVKFITPTSAPYRPSESEQDFGRTLRQYALDPRIGLSAMSFIRNERGGDEGLDHLYEGLSRAKDAWEALYNSPVDVCLEPGPVRDNLAAARSSFEEADMRELLQPDSWFGRMQAEFDSKKENCFTVVWEAFLSALESANRHQAAETADELRTIAPEDIRLQVDKLLGAWNRHETLLLDIGSDMKVLERYVERIRRDEGGEYLKEMRGYLAELNGLHDGFASQEEGAPARRLTASPEWAEYRSLIGTITRMVDLLEAFRAGDHATFTSIYEADYARLSDSVLLLYKGVIDEWTGWKNDRGSDSNWLANQGLRRRLTDIRGRIQKAVGIRETDCAMRREVDEFWNQRERDGRAKADAMRDEARRLEGYPRIFKLLDAYELDHDLESRPEGDPTEPTRSSQEVINSAVVAQLTIENKARQESGGIDRDNLIEVRRRMQALVEQGAAQEDQFTAIRQIESILK